MRKSTVILIVLFSFVCSQAAFSGKAELPPVKLTVEPGHSWTPPFGLERVGRPLDAVVEVPGGVKTGEQYTVVCYRDGKEIGRKPVRFPGNGQEKNLRFGRATLDDWPVEVALLSLSAASTAGVELARASVKPPAFEAEALAWPDRVIHPVDLGTILVPNGWLLLAGGQRATVDVAALTRGGEVTGGRISAWYESTPDRKVETALALKSGEKTLAKLELAACSGTRKNDKLQVMIADGAGKELWRKTIPVMIVPEPPQVPRFAAVETKLRYDEPIRVRGASSINYDDGWDPQRKDVVVYLPNGGRFVFWRGASYCPFWAGRSNTGFCYEWAELFRFNKGKCEWQGEPLWDTELRYGRVAIVESTSARIHVRWDYQCGSQEHKVWNNSASEDFYFYPDGFATRVLTVVKDPAAAMEVQEFIILLPQSGYPFEYIPEAHVDMIHQKGKFTFSYPCRQGLDGQEAQWDRYQRERGKWLPMVHCFRYGKADPLKAIEFSPATASSDFPGFKPIIDRGVIATPMWWGAHWPLSRGYNCESRISNLLHEQPSGACAYHTYSKPLSEQTGPLLDATGQSGEMTRKTYCWLIGATDASDEQLRQWMQSSSHSAAVEATGAGKAVDCFVSQRRAFCLAVNPGSKLVELKITPAGWCVNPVFELKDAPKELKRVSLDGKELDARRYAWDGKTLWVDASLNHPADLRLEF